MATIKEVHRNHFMLIDNNCVVSFNPEVVSVENMLEGNYTVSINSPLSYLRNEPFKDKYGCVFCTESHLARSI